MILFDSHWVVAGWRHHREAGLHDRDLNRLANQRDASCRSHLCAQRKRRADIPATNEMRCQGFRRDCNVKQIWWRWWCYCWRRRRLASSAPHRQRGGLSSSLGQVSMWQRVWGLASSVHHHREDWPTSPLGYVCMGTEQGLFVCVRTRVLNSGGGRTLSS